MKRTDKEQKFWDSFAKRYDDNNKKTANETYNHMYDLFLEDIAGSKNMLEIATGTGLISLKLSSEIPQITAIDLSPQMLIIAKEKAKKQSVKNVIFRVGDICNLEFSDNSFDTVIASNVLHLLFEPLKALQEIRRVVVSDGKVIIPTYCHGENFKSQFISRCMNIIGFRARSRWSVNLFEKFVTENGFKVVRRKVLKGWIPLVYLVVKPV